MKKSISSIMVILAAVLWGTMGIWVRHMESYGFTSMELVLIRCIGTAVLMTLFLLIYNRSLFKIRLKDIWCFFGTGVISIVFFSYCYFTTITLTNLSVAAVLLYTAPAFVAVMSAIFFKERMTLGKLLALLAALIGCVFVSGILKGNFTLPLSGLLLGLGSGIGYALYSIFGRFAINRGYHSFTITLYTFYLALPGALFLAKPGVMLAKLATHPESAFYALGVVVVTTVLPYIFYTLGLSGMEAGRASILACVEPLTASVIGIVLYKEVPDAITLIGILLVLSATVFVNIKNFCLHSVKK